MMILNSNLSISTIVANGLPGSGSAAIDWAIDRGLNHSGWCGKLPIRKAANQSQYDLNETASSGYLQSLALNVRDSDATIVFTLTPTISQLVLNVMDVVSEEVKPFLHFRPGVHPKWIASFLARNQVRVLHIVGARETIEPGIGEFVTQSLDLALCSVVNEVLSAAA